MNRRANNRKADAASRLQLLNQEQLRQFNQHLESVCRGFVSEISSAELSDRLTDYILHGGKRIRPQLLLWTYANAAESSVEFPKAALDAAIAWELFHAFLLIHDDIIDGSDQRRGYPALHRQLQSLDSNSPRFGANLGIVAGDLFYAWANRLLANLDAPADAFRDLHRLFTRVATLTGLGQAVDVMQSHTELGRRDEQTLLQEYHWKTAAYTFEGPMLSAAILAGLPQPAHAAISRFALSLGQAYQMQNDLLDIVRPVTEGSDLVEGKHTYTLLKARECLIDGDRKQFDRDIQTIVASEGRAIGLAESVRQRLLRTEAVPATHHRIAQLLDDSLADVSDLPPSLSRAIAGCLAEMRRRYFVQPSYG